MVRDLTKQDYQVFNPETLLGLIIDKIKEYNKLASESSLNQEDQKAIMNENSEESDPLLNEVSEQENIYIGLI